MIKSMREIAEFNASQIEDGVYKIAIEEAKATKRYWSACGVADVDLATMISRQLTDKLKSANNRNAEKFGTCDPHKLETLHAAAHAMIDRVVARVVAELFPGSPN